MKNSKLTISNVLSNSWQLTFNNYLVIISSFGIIFAISIFFNIVQNIISNLQQGNNSVIVAIVLVLATIVSFVLNQGIQTLIAIGFTRVQLNIVDHKPANLAMLFHPEGVFWRYLGGTILFSLIIIGGLILFIVPGIIWGLKYQFALPLIVDKKLTVRDALQTSGKITKGHKGWIFGLMILLGLINIAGILALGFGLLVTIPLTNIAFIWAYRVLSQNSQNKKLV